MMRLDQLLIGVLSVISLPFIIAGIFTTLRKAADFIINGDNNEDLD